jgi:outer membrane protein assembly factor BamB
VRRRGFELATSAVVAALSLSACSSSASPQKHSTSTGAPASTATTTSTSSLPPSTVPRPPVASSWDTYGGDLARDNVASLPAHFGKLRSLWVSAVLDGQIYGRPLVSGGLVIVATEGDTVYGLNAGTGRVVWSTNVGTPVPLSMLPCGNIDPLGITGTPAMDPVSGHLFALAERLVGGKVSHTLVALDPRNGKLLFEESADPPAMGPTDQQQRPALAVSHGRVYIAYGGLYGDCGTYKGWVVALPTSAPGAMISYEVPAANQAAIWAPAGPEVDAHGDIWVATGNGSSDTTYDEGDSVLELSSSLRLLQSFAPSQWVADNVNDLDLGSTTPQLLNDGLVFEVGKESTGYLLSASHLGGIGGQLYEADVCFVIGANAYKAPDIYVPCKDGLEQVVVRDKPTPSFSIGWKAPSEVNGPPLLAGGLLWSVGQSTDTLYGLNETNGAIVQQIPLSAAVDNYATPSAAAGMLVVGTGDTVRAFSSP